MSKSPIVALLTDFGTQDSYVAEMKGVMLSLNPELRLVDITHSIPPGDIRGGAYLLWRAQRWFPGGTIFLSVVDPGVGSERRILLVKTRDHYHVAPDNGLLTLVARECEHEVWEVADRRFMCSEISDTFHGRDIMAPVCAHLSLGETDALAFGPRIERIVRFEIEGPAASGSSIEGEIISVDRFGNAVTNIDDGLLTELGPLTSLSVSIGGLRVDEIGRTFSTVRDGERVAYVGSAGLLELAVNGGDFAKLYGVQPGVRVRVDHGRP